MYYLGADQQGLSLIWFMESLKCSPAAQFGHWMRLDVAWSYVVEAIDLLR
jgi:hypothetical protein